MMSSKALKKGNLSLLKRMGVPPIILRRGIVVVALAIVLEVILK